MAAPLACGLVLLAGLAGWVATGGAGTISRVRIQVTRATVPMVSYTARGAAGRSATAYLTIRNLAGHGDVLLSASSPDAARVIVARRAGPGAVPAHGGLAVPALGTISLSPFGPDLVLIGPRPLMAGQQVLLRLRFRDAGLVTVEAMVTPPGTP